MQQPPTEEICTLNSPSALLKNQVGNRSRGSSAQTETSTSQTSSHQRAAGWTSNQTPPQVAPPGPARRERTSSNLACEGVSFITRRRDNCQTPTR